MPGTEHRGLSNAAGAPDFYRPTSHFATANDAPSEMSASTGTRYHRRISFGGALLILSGLLFLSTPFFVVGTITPPDEGQVITETSAVNANSLEWRLGMALSFVALAALVLGLFALYAHLAGTRMERWALSGLIITVGSLFVYLPLLGVMAFVLPAVGGLIEGGSTDAIVVLDQTWKTPFIILPFLGGLLWNVGVALMGFTVWRSATPSKWGGIALVIAGILGIPAFLDVVAIQYIAPVVLAIGLMTIGVALWRTGRNSEYE